MATDTRTRVPRISQCLRSLVFVDDGANSVACGRSFDRLRFQPRQYMPLVAFCLRHFSKDFIICTCEFELRQAQAMERDVRSQYNEITIFNFCA